MNHKKQLNWDVKELEKLPDVPDKMHNPIAVMNWWPGSNICTREVGPTLQKNCTASHGWRKQWTPSISNKAAGNSSYALSAMNSGQHVSVSRTVMCMFAQGANVTSVNPRGTLRAMTCIQEKCPLACREWPKLRKWSLLEPAQSCVCTESMVDNAVTKDMLSTCHRIYKGSLTVYPVVLVICQYWLLDVMVLRTPTQISVCEGKKFSLHCSGSRQIILAIRTSQLTMMLCSASQRMVYLLSY